MPKLPSLKLVLALAIVSLGRVAGSDTSGEPSHTPGKEKPFQPTWNSLTQARTPQWLREGKFGIYTHWGIYSVPAQGPNGTWFANRVYSNKQPERKYWEGNELRYTGEELRFTVKGNVLYATALAWPGDQLRIRSFAPKYNWPGIYPSEIASITLLGDGKELKWSFSKEGLCIETPKTKPCAHAFVFKIIRRNPF
jgi:hypothetical protein